MKIAIPVNEKSIESGISNSFGRTPYYLIYDSVSKEATYIDNSAAASRGGAGIKAAQLLVDQKVDGVITPRCGQNAAEVLHVADIEIYKSLGDSVEENIKAIDEDKLEKLEEIHEGFHGNGGN